ncbi:hypothetical protein Trydic_g8944 [Trypoxylus dichotomus]
MPNQARRQNSVESEGPGVPGNEKGSKPSPTKGKPMQKLEKSAAKTGWFGGIFSGFGLRPKNQMKLPDDKNPSIVWDETRKKWINLDEDGSEANTEVKPPPKLADMMPKVQQNITGVNGGQPGQQAPYGTTPANPAMVQGNPAGAPIGEEAPKSTQPNMFKLQRGRNLKKSYVDVFNPGGKSSENSQAMAQNPVFLGAPAPSSGNQVNFFVPAPVNDPNAPVDFLTPANVNADNSQKKRANKS